MIIEFIGLPGSGKTTLANKLIDSKKCFLVQPEKHYNVSFFYRYFYPIALYSKYSVAYNGLNKKVIFQIKCFVRNVKKIDSVINISDNSVFVIDEGIFAPINTTIPKEKIEQFICEITRNPYLLRYVQGNRFLFIAECPDLCIERILNRRQAMPNFLRNLSKEQINRIFSEIIEKQNIEMKILRNNMIQIDELSGS